MKSFLLLIMALYLSACATVSEDEQREKEELAKPVGQLNNVNCKGNDKISCEFIKNYFHKSIGQEFSKADLKYFQSKLLFKDSISEAEVNFDFNDDDTFDVDVKIKEKEKPFVVISHFGPIIRNNNLGVMLGVDGSHDNFDGNGGTLSLLAHNHTEPRIKNVFFYKTFLRAEYESGPLKFNKDLRWRLGLDYLDLSFQDAEELKSFRDNTLDNTQTAIDLSLHVWRGFYLGYQNYLQSDVKEVEVDSQSNIVTTDIEYKSTFFVTADWGLGSDDPEFPTQIKEFMWTLRWTDREQNAKDDSFFSAMVGIQRLWKKENGNIWKVQFGDPIMEIGQPNFPYPGMGVGFGRDFDTKWASKARWMIEGGLDYFGYSSYQGFIWGAAGRYAVRLKTENFGLIDLFTFIRLNSDNGY